MGSRLIVPPPPTLGLPRSPAKPADAEVIELSASQVLEVSDLFVETPQAPLEVDPADLESLHDGVVLADEEDWSPAESIPQLEVDEAWLEPESEPDPIAQAEDEAGWSALIEAAKATDVSSTPSAMETADAAPLPTAAPAPAPKSTEERPGSWFRAADVSTCAPWEGSSGKSLPRRRPVGWIVGACAAASAALVMGVYGFVPSDAHADVPAPEPSVIMASEVEPDPTPTVKVPEVAPTPAPKLDKVAARKLAVLGTRQLDAGHSATARRMFDKALDANPKSRLAHVGLGRIALSRNDASAALKHLRAGVKLEPRDAKTRRLLGDALAKLGRSAKATEQYEKASALGDDVAASRLAN